MVYMVIWVVLMMFWLFGVSYISYDATRPYGVGTVIIPWLCVLILGLFQFGGIKKE